MPRRPHEPIALDVTSDPASGGDEDVDVVSRRERVSIGVVPGLRRVWHQTVVRGGRQAADARQAGCRVCPCVGLGDEQTRPEPRLPRRIFIGQPIHLVDARRDRRPRGRQPLDAAARHTPCEQLTARQHAGLFGSQRSQVLTQLLRTVHHPNLPSNRCPGQRPVPAPVDGRQPRTGHVDDESARIARLRRAVRAGPVWGGPRSGHDGRTAR